MAAVGTRNVCSTTNLVAASGNLVGQGNLPDLWIMYSTDTADDTDPLWQDATAKVRSFQTSRGRENELSEVDAGTATIVVDNRERDFDPVADPLIRPLNRWWIREQFAGETQSIFLGYAESYDQNWVLPNDAYAVVTCSDEFSRLARARLPVTDPPRDTYADVVMFDQPSAYWPLDERTTVGANPAALTLANAAVGQALIPTETLTSVDSAIVGADDFGISISGTQQLATGALTEGASGDVGGLADFTLEVWLKGDDVTPGATELLIRGPLSSSNPQWKLELNTTGTVSVVARNSGGTNHTVTSAVLSDGRWYHIVGSLSGGTLTLYVDGVSADTEAWAGVFGAMDADSEVLIGDGSLASVYYLDELAVYRYGLGSGRVAAHHTAGTARGFARGQLAGARAGAILDLVASQAPRRLDAGVRAMTGAFTRGQDVLGELRQGVRAESSDALLFIARDGAVVFLDSDHRSSSPYNTVQATFDDDGTDLPYHELDLDYSDAFLFNEVNATRIGGPLDVSSDTTSINTYGKRPTSITDLPITTQADVTAIGDAVLAKYKEPITRILSITFKTSNADLTEALFRRDLGDKVRILRTPPGGGTRLDQSVWVQKVSVSGVPGVNGSLQATVTWAVSPL